MKRTILLITGMIVIINCNSQISVFRLNDLEYFEKEGTNIIAFQDIYPEGHQSGITLIMHGMRLATSGDIRLNEIPGQWQPIPRQQKRIVNHSEGLISVTLTYPDSVRNRRGFNPIEYPDLYFNYTVKVRSVGKSVIVSVDLDRPIPDEFKKRVGFNLELFPGYLFGKYWYMDGKSGLFPRQPHGPALPDKSVRLMSAAPLPSGELLAVQMCHMRVNEKYRVWHGLCHMDDARMAPININHFDGYRQGESTLTKYMPGEHVPGLNLGGWHDAGDYDFRVESQSEEIYIMTLAYENFNLRYDETTIDQKVRLVEIHQPDGKPDILQQIEHGALTIVRGYQNLGRLYRGIICPTLRQYVLLGDGSTMTDGLIHSDQLAPGQKSATYSSPEDDRGVFTENNPSRELLVAAHLAGASRALNGYNDTLSNWCVRIAESIYANDYPASPRLDSPRTHAAIELYLTTGKEVYKNFLLMNERGIIKDIANAGYLMGRVLPLINNTRFTKAIKAALIEYSSVLKSEIAETPYGIPYQPRVWGAGWEIQKFGVRQYFLHTGFPEIFPPTYLYNALNFILGVHPGSNTSSFASGIGGKSTTTAYGFNRADWSYIPGGVSSGTGLIRPDFPELLDFPFLWQQQEYCIGGRSTDFMFMALGANKLLNKYK